MLLRCPTVPALCRRSRAECAPTWTHVWRTTRVSPSARQLRGMLHGCTSRCRLCRTEAAGCDIQRCTRG
eukprot:349702-Chlamydomonas_euryale.AAC.8